MIETITRRIKACSGSESSSLANLSLIIRIGPKIPDRKEEVFVMQSTHASRILSPMPKGLLLYRQSPWKLYI